MKNQSSLLRRAGVFILAFLALAVFGQHARAGTGEKEAKKRADIVIIDDMARHGKLEMPPAVFLHDRHTKALADAKKDCSSCHQPVKAGDASAGYSFSVYMGSDTVKAKDLKDFYHKSCIGCHASMKGKTGPQETECRSCHNPRPAVKSDWQDIGLDKVLHYKHIASAQVVFAGDAKKNCGACHHVYDSASEKLVWGKEKEDSCRACHLLPDALAAKRKAADVAAPGSADALADENGLLKKRPTLDVAAHQACVNCHLKVAALNKPEIKTGPATCAGCHSPAAQAKLAAEGINNKAIADSVPRLERGQPDAALMMAAPEKTKDLVSSMRPVSFNHKIHEASARDCRTCHHQKISSCSSCHSLEGKAEGGFVTQAKAMHAAASKRSCIGCHAAETQKPSCAGCHAAPQQQAAQSACAACHATPAGVSDADAENASLLKLDKESRTALAKATVAERGSARVSTLATADIPEKVTIGLLAKDYQPAELPHRKIVEALAEKQKDSRLAAVFHAEKTTLCQGCHHNSPPSKTPPKCVSCHGVDVTAATGAGARLPLAAAYHKQCMTCHASMAQKPLQDDCAGCHKPKGK